MDKINIKNKIKSVLIIHPTLGYNGGAENVIISTVREWNKLGIQTTVCTNSCRDNLSIDIRQIKVPIVLNPFTLKKTSKLILDDIKKNNYDAIIIHNFPASIFWGKIYDIASSENIELPKSFWYCHEPSVRLYGSDEASYKKLSKIADPIARYWKKIDKYGVEKIGHIFANSSRTSKHINIVYGRDSKVIYPCSDYDTVKNTHGKKNCFFYVGRIEKPKNIDIAINAFKKFKNNSKEKNIKFFIAGKGRYEKYIKKYIAKTNMTNSVEMLGYISDEQKHNYIANAYSLVSIADREPFGLSIIEAWAFGSTAIISKYSGASEIVAHNSDAIVVEPSDENTIAEYMLRLVEDKNYREIIYKNGSEVIESKKFSNYTYAAALLHEIEKRI